METYSDQIIEILKKYDVDASGVTAVLEVLAEAMDASYESGDEDGFSKGYDEGWDEGFQSCQEESKT